MSAELATRIAVLENEFKNIHDKMSGCDRKLDQILEALHGNGHPGMKTDVALALSRISRLWWAFGIGITVYGTLLAVVWSS